MRVVFLSDANSIHTARWVNAFAERGHEIYLLYNRNQTPRVHKIDERVKQIPLIFSGKIGYYANRFQLHSILKDIKPDIVNAHYASGYGTLARVTGIKKMILSVWGSDVYDFPYQSKMNYKIIRKNLLHTNYIASTSECMANKVRELLGEQVRRIVVTPFGVDLKKFDPQIIQSNKDKLRVGVIKNLQRIYGIDDFLKAMQIVRNELKQENNELADQICVEIYGEGEQETELKKLSQKLGIEDIVDFKGRISNDKVPEVLAQLSVFCNMTRVRESFGVSVVEAMAMKVPVVVTDAEGTVEVTANGAAGIVVEKQNIKEMANQIKKLLLDEVYRKQIGEVERKRVEAVYDWEKNVDIMENFYKEVIER